MNRCLAVWVVSILMCVAWVGTAAAQVGPGGSPGSPSGAQPGPTPAAPPAVAGPIIPPAAETATEATQYTSAIRAFIVYHLNIMSGSDGVAATASRDAVRKTLSRGSTPSYYAIFCREWSTACSVALTKTPPSPLGMRLNIAILTSVLTDNGQTMDPPALVSAESLVELLLGDSAASVSIWGVKAARPLVTLRIQLPDSGGKHAIDATPLVADIVASVRKHQKSDTSSLGIAGFLTEDAYNTLAVKEVAGLTDDKVKAIQPPLVSPILDILALRVAQYKDGSIPEPGAERTIATFLSGQYKLVDAATQKRMIQLLTNLEVYAGQRSDQYINSKTDLAQLRDTLKYVASALKVIAGDKSVDNGLSWLSSIQPASTPPEIVAHTALVPGVLKPVFTWLLNPPPIPVMDPPAMTKVDTPAPPVTPPSR